MVESDERPWWDRALDVLRYEANAFRFLLWTIAVAVVIGGAVLLGRAIF
jgi:hypothetical protein